MQSIGPLQPSYSVSIICLWLVGRGRIGLGCWFYSKHFSRFVLFVTFWFVCMLIFKSVWHASQNLFLLMIIAVENRGCIQVNNYGDAMATTFKYEPQRNLQWCDVQQGGCRNTTSYVCEWPFLTIGWWMSTWLLAWLLKSQTNSSN